MAKDDLVTIADVAKRAGVTPPAVYSYAKSNNMRLSSVGKGQMTRQAISREDANSYLASRALRLGASYALYEIPEPVAVPEAVAEEARIVHAHWLPEDVAPDGAAAPPPRADQPAPAPVIQSPPAPPLPAQESAAPDLNLADRMARVESALRVRIAEIDAAIDTLQAERDVLDLEVKDAAAVVTALNTAERLLRQYEGMS